MKEKSGREAAEDLAISREWIESRLSRQKWFLVNSMILVALALYLAQFYLQYRRDQTAYDSKQREYTIEKAKEVVGDLYSVEATRNFMASNCEQLKNDKTGFNEVWLKLFQAQMQIEGNAKLIGVLTGSPELEGKIDQYAEWDKGFGEDCGKLPSREEYRKRREVITDMMRKHLKL